MTSEEKPVSRHPIRDGFMLFFAGLFLLLAQSAYWINHTIFDQQAFTSIVTPIVQSQSSRQAIASTITAKAFADNPIANRLIGQNVTQLLTGLLGTDFALQLQSGLIQRTYEYLTTENPKPIAIDLQPIKDPIVKITDLLEARGNNVTINPEKIPDTIVLFNPAGLPNLYAYSVAMLWLGPLFWLGFIILAVLYIYLGRHNYAPRVYLLGGTIILASIIGLLIGPIIEPPIVALVPMAELRGIAGQLIAALLAPFSSQNTTVIAITAIVLVIFALRHAIANGVRWIAAKASLMMSKPKTPTGTKQL